MASVDTSGTIPPEVRLGKITEFREVMIDFTNPINLPSLKNFITRNEEANHELLNVMMLSGDSEEIDENLIAWKITAVEPKQIRVELEFQSAIKVSQGEMPDKIVVQA